jgi:hypothetical protein
MHPEDGGDMFLRNVNVNELHGVISLHNHCCGNLNKFLRLFGLKGSGFLFLPRNLLS